MAITQPPPNIKRTPTVQIQQPLMDVNLWQHAYDVTLEKAVRCPCTARDENNSALTNCQNCSGYGWLFINSVTTKALISSINKQSKYSEWSEELIGTVNVSFKDNNDEDFSDKLSLMDRVTLIDNYSIFSENKKVKTADDTQKFIFCAYPIVEVEAVFVFNTSSTALIRLTSDNYVISTNNPYVLELNFTPGGNFNSAATIRYRHKLTYHIIDIQNDARRTLEVNPQGQEIQKRLPVHAIARKAHQELSVPDYDGTGVQDNSFE